MNFAFPWAFILLVFLPLFIDRDLFRQKAAVPFASSSLSFRGAMSVKAKLRPVLLSIFSLAAWCMLVISLARPQSTSEITPTEFTGKDIILVLDISDSMRALDFYIDRERVDRLAALKKVVSEFVEERKSDRLGLVVFGRQAFTMSPLTFDWSLVKSFVENLTIGMADPRGTAIGDALAVALKRINFKSDSKVIVLVTDGTNNSGSVTPAEAASVAASRGVRVHTIAVGTGGDVPIPVKNRIGLLQTVRQNIPIDEETLKEIAETTGGVFFNAENFEKLKLVYDEIDKLEGREDTVESFKLYKEHYSVFSYSALGLLIIYVLLSIGPLFRIP